MSRPPSLAARLSAARPWTGVVVPPAAWILCQQGAGTLVYGDCMRSGPPLGPILALAAVAVCAAAGWASWSAPRGADAPLRDLLRHGGAGIAAIFALASLVLAASTLLVPSCAR